MVREEKRDFFFPMQEPISRLAWAVGLAVCVCGCIQSTA